jgi:hypothetical protein
MMMFLGLPLWIWIAVGVAAVGAATYAIVRRVRFVRARRAIDNVISSVAFDLLKNVLLPAGPGELVHLNYLLLTQRGLLVVDLFDLPGMIFAGEKMENWSVFGRSVTTRSRTRCRCSTTGSPRCVRSPATFGRRPHRVLDAR